MSENREWDLFLSRLDDLARKAERGELAVGPFLSPRERALATQHLARKGVPYRTFGGYADAERCRVYLLPSYMEESDADLPLLLSDYGYESRVACLFLKGSGYGRIEHRSVLGSLLGLGLERSVIGDILMLDGENGGAYVFCDEPIVPFLLSEWKKAGNDTIKLSRVAPEDVKIPERRFSPIRDTLASPRLDGVVAALCRLSREKAKTAVENGMVELNFALEERPDRTVEEGAIISVRGFGRFRVLSVSDQTKKGRFRLEAQKYL